MSEQSKLSKANELFRLGDLNAALEKYCEVASESPDMSAHVIGNIELIKNRLLGGAAKSKLEIYKTNDGKSMPDLFNYRAEPAHAKRLVVFWNPKFGSYYQSLTVLCNAGVAVDAVVILNHDDPGIVKLLSIAKCSRIVVVIFPGVVNKSSSFVRLINEGIFWKYDEIIFANELSDEGRNDDVNLLINVATEDVDLCAESIVSFDLSQDHVLNGIFGTWFARIQRKKPSVINSMPKGFFKVKSYILRQISGYQIAPGSIESMEYDPDSRFVLIQSLIGALIDEGGCSVSSFVVSAEQKGVIDKRENKHIDFKLIAFYLPQFHVVDVNDKWWGKGFTEWNNVVRARPQFRSHYQPKVPADLGYYDLRSLSTQKKQAELAKRFGIHGFCYYYYWFDGLKLLNEPIEQMLENDEVNIPFCVCWANEHWSRNWDGQNRHVLVEQRYTNESNRALIREFIRMMKDPRYIKFNDKPVLLVYRIKLIPNWPDVARMWRQECRDAGIGEIHLCSIRFSLEPLEGDPAVHGLDSYVLFPPQDMNFVDAKKDVYDLNQAFNGSIFSYDAVVDGDIERFRAGYPWPVHRGAMLGWDNTARRMHSSRIFIGCSPMRYKYWLENIFNQERINSLGKESLVFINAWNEWAEGTTLEPDARYGTAYLDVSKSVLQKYSVDSIHSHGANKEVLIPEEASKKRISYLKVLHPAGVVKYFDGNADFRNDGLNVLVCAHISGHQLFGGERSFLDVVQALNEMGCNVFVVLPSANNKSYIEALSRFSICVYSFPYRQWVSDRGFDALNVLRFIEIINTRKIDIVYSNTIVLIEPAEAAKIAGVQSWVHARELITVDDALRERIGLPVQTIIQRVFERYDVLIANSHATESVFKRSDKTFYAPNAVDIKEFDSTNAISSVIKFGIVSSNIPKKGLSDFVRVASLLRDISKICEFVVIGPDNESVADYKRKVASGELPENIKFLGYRETPAVAMKELNVLLNLSSFAESFGRTVAEAMASARPVIAYEWGALPELVNHGENGYLAPFGDVNSVASYVRSFINSPELVKKMGLKGREYVANYFSRDVLRSKLSVPISNARKVLRQSGNPVISSIRELTIVVPVYNAAEEVENCLRSLVEHAQHPFVSVLVIDDGSPDPKVKPVLSKFVNQPKFVILSNDSNIGYTKTINKAIMLRPNDDIVLLNSDTVVTPGWITGLRACAYSRSKVGTVTAMSDNAGAFSFPVQGKLNPKPKVFSIDEYAMRVVDASLFCRPVDVTTGSGFCMYIRRDAINEVGLFDDVLFPRGYGEENDFCMRMRDKGWINFVTPWAFVYHVRTASFKGEKDKLIQSGVNAVTKKYPNYAPLTKASFSSVDMLNLRSTIEAAFRGLE